MKRRVACFLAVLFISGISYALTLSDIETQVRRNIRDTDSSIQRYSDTILDAVINEAQDVVVNETWCLRLSTAITLVAGTTYYNLPDDFIAVYQVNFLDNSNQWGEMEQISEKVLYDTNPDFEHGGANAPTEYFIRYSTSGGNNLQFGVNPIPSTTSTGTVRIDYHNQATDMSSDSDVPFDGLLHLYPYHDTLWSYATFRIKVLEGKTDEADVYAKLYDRKVEIMKERFKTHPNYNPSIKGAPR